MNSTQIEPEYKDNASRISELISFLQQIREDSTIDIVNVSFCGAASPEGSYEWNRKLANGRLKALEEVVRSKVEIPDSIITYNDSYIPWEYLASQIAESDIAHKESILSIIGEKSQIVHYYSRKSIDSRILKLQRLAGGKVWREMLRRFFSPMRNSSAIFITYRRVGFSLADIEQPLIGNIEVPTTDGLSVKPINVEFDLLPTPAPFADVWERKLYLKSNVLGWGLAIANAAVEMDIHRHWSFNLPVYYSAWNYFSARIKFRTLAIQPEIRYWFSGKRHCNDGLFVGAHLGIAYYNIATNGAYRTQDHDGTSPAIGGGLAVGYRLPISKDSRWKMEFSIGAGAYSLHHDKFINYPNGPLVYTDKMVYVGPDQASVSFSYTFDVKKRKGTAR